MTLKDEILYAADGQLIEAIIIGPFGWAYNDELDQESFNFNKKFPVPKRFKNKPISWETAEKYLDYEYYTGYGSLNCHAFYAYTIDRIIFVSTYDGSTSVEIIPRNPIKCRPEMFGG